MLKLSNKDVRRLGYKKILKAYFGTPEIPDSVWVDIKVTNSGMIGIASSPFTFASYYGGIEDLLGSYYTGLVDLINFRCKGYEGINLQSRFRNVWHSFIAGLSEDLGVDTSLQLLLSEFGLKIALRQLTASTLYYDLYTSLIRWYCFTFDRRDNVEDLVLLVENDATDFVSWLRDVEL